MKNYAEKIKKLERELAKLKKAIAKSEEYRPVIANGLIWSKIAEKEMNWSDAMEYAKRLKEGGCNDWRLPTISELQNVFDYEKGEPKIKCEGMSYFWSSTEYYNNSDYAWLVLLNYGTTLFSTKVTGHAVRCVRREKLK